MQRKHAFSSHTPLSQHWAASPPRRLNPVRRLRATHGFGLRYATQLAIAASHALCRTRTTSPDELRPLATMSRPTKTVVRELKSLERGWDGRAVSSSLFNEQVR